MQIDAILPAGATSGERYHVQAMQARESMIPGCNVVAASAFKDMSCRINSGTANGKLSGRA